MLPTITRRNLHLAGAAMAAAPLLGWRAADAAAPFLNNQAPPFHRFRVGGFEATIVTDGPLVLPALTDVLPDAPRATLTGLLAANRMPTDRWTGPQNVLIVNTGRHVVLFDTGMGDRSKVLGDNVGQLVPNMRAAGIDPASVDVVAITHAHIDHCWALVDRNDRLNFPNARVAIAQSDFDFWTQESLLANRAAFDFVQFTRTNLLPVRDRLIAVRDGAEIVPGITAMPTAGHTVGHHSFVIESEGRRLINLGDVFHHHVLLLRHPEWHNIFDSDRAAGAATRRRMLDTLARDGTQVASYHFPWPGIGTIARDGDRAVWLPSPLFE